MSFPFFDSLELENFTCFKECKLDFCPGVNIIVGENGAGKTHILKVLHAWSLAKYREKGLKNSLQYYLQRNFGVDEIELLRNLRTEESAFFNIKCSFGGKKSAYRLPINPGEHKGGKYIAFEVPRPVFIPSLEMMSHLAGFVSLYDEFDMDFDYTYRDIAHLLSLPRRKINGEQSKVSNELVKNARLPKLVWRSEEQRYYYVIGKKSLPSTLMAEGLRKLSTLTILIEQGIIEPGSVVLWDEPEVNINPSLLDELVKAILQLSDSGIQFILTTHSYPFLKEFELFNTFQVPVRYFALSRNDDDFVGCDSFESLSEVAPNKILDQYLRLHDQDLKLRLRKSGQ